MEITAELLRWLHVGAGFVGLAAFWVPIFSRKGGKNHRLFGKIFKYCAYLVLAAAALSLSIRISSDLMNNLGPLDAPRQFAFLIFLAYLTIVTFIGLRHGLQVLRHKASLLELNQPVNRLLARLAIACSLTIIAYGLYFNPSLKILLFALSPIGFGIGFGILTAIQKENASPRIWFYEHMGAMMGTGIAFHTAFAVFGSIQIFDFGLSGWLAVIPWVLPALIGIPTIIIWTRHYKRKFKDLAT